MAKIMQKQANTMSGSGLFLLGIGGIIGAGYFLGIGIAVQQAGPAVLISLLLGAFIMAQVLGTQIHLTMNHPLEGSFRAYATEQLSPFVGYLQGWLYYIASMLTLGSEAIAMAVFARLWFPFLPLWILALTFTVIVVGINLFGVAIFTKLEGFLSVIKIAAILLFVAIAGIWRWVTFPNFTGRLLMSLTEPHGFMPHGINGVFTSMLVVIFAYSGIGVLASATTQLRDLQEAKRAATGVILGITLLYLLSMLALLTSVPANSVGTSSSPFVFALQQLHYGWLAQFLNVVILLAAFTVMAGALFSSVLITQAMVDDRIAPRFLRRKPGQKVAYRAVIFSSFGAVAAIVLSYVLPSQVYNDLISSTSFITLLNWIIMILTWLVYMRHHRHEALIPVGWVRGGRITAWLTIIVILALAIAAFLEPSLRYGGLAALAIIVFIMLTYPIVMRR
nr:amino acid permease [Bacilli bacterium]